MEGLILGEAVSHRNGIFPWKGKRGRNQGFDTWQESTECKGLCALLSQAGSSRDGTSQGKPGQMGHSCTSQLQKCCSLQGSNYNKTLQMDAQSFIEDKSKVLGVQGKLGHAKKRCKKNEESAMI